MAISAADDLAGRVARAMFERDAAAQSMGIRIVDAREGVATVAMTVRPEMLNGHAITHGGLVFALADTAFAYACNSRNEAVVALACSITFSKPTYAGDEIVAAAQERTRANRTSTYDVTVTCRDEIVALFRGTGYRIKGSHV